ncbi:MAG: O-antigen ligase family protein [Granulosicoccus sp.]
MDSTNPLLNGSTDTADGDVAASGGARKRGAGARTQIVRDKSRFSLRKLREMAVQPDEAAGWPEFDGLKPVLCFLAIPSILVLAITVTGGHWPTSILYAFALVLGVIVAISALHSVELVLSVLLIYLPFSKIFVIPIAPGINGTNMLLILGLFASVLRILATRQRLTDWPAGSYLVFAFGFLTSISAFTMMLNPGGRVFLLYSEILSYKAWLDQFVFYFIVLICVRDIETAKRCFIYVIIGSVLVVLFAVPEMLEKSGRSTIEKSRIEGPHLQSNNFGGFVAYTILPLIALFLTYIKDVRAWLLTPYFLLTAKVLITTFSRGAYVAIVIGAFLAGWFKGKGFLALWLSIALSFFLVFPSMLPDSVLARMDTFTEDANSAAPAEEKLDQSSATRLIMWRAAATMMAEDPIWGKGFKGFEFFKDDYIFIDVRESDPHSMYFYIGSQMGLPSLSLFLVILIYSFWLGRTLSQDKNDKFIRVIGIGGAAATACFAVVCIFGSRAVSLNFTVYFWTFFVIMQVIRRKQLEAEVALNPRPVRTFAIDLVRQEAAGLAMGSANQITVSSANEGLRSGLQDENPKVLGWQKNAATGKSRGPSRGAAFHQEVAQGESQKPHIREAAETASVCRVAEVPGKPSHASPVKRKLRREKKRLSSIQKGESGILG